MRQTVTVNYATADGTATAGGDYVARSGMLSFAPGVSAQGVAITVDGDTAVEPNETFSVGSSSASNATIARVIHHHSQRRCGGDARSGVAAIGDRRQRLQPDPERQWRCRA